MKPANGSYTLTASSMTTKFAISAGTTGTTTFDTFTWNSDFDMFIGNKTNVCIRFVDGSSFLAMVGIPPNHTTYSGTYTSP